MATKELVWTPYGYGEIDVLLDQALVVPTPTEPSQPEVVAPAPIPEVTIKKVVFKWGGIGYISVIVTSFSQTSSRRRLP